MASKFKAGMLNFIEVLNQMWDAFAAGPYNALPLTGGTMTGALINTVGVYAASTDTTNFRGISSSLLNVNASSIADPISGQYVEAARIGVRGVPGLGYYGAWRFFTSAGSGAVDYAGHTMGIFASDNRGGGGTAVSPTPTLKLYGTGRVDVAGILYAPVLRVGGALSDTISSIEATSTNQGATVLALLRSAEFFVTSGGAANAAASAAKIGANSVTNRSIATPGSINANGADYAEYLIKRLLCGTIAPGQIVGIDSDGRLTDKWDVAISFAVKSTNPCMVGGDTWAAHLGRRPDEPVRPSAPVREAGITDEQWDVMLSAYQGGEQEFQTALTALQEFDLALEAARQTVDRIAFAGQVPVNLLGATPGQFIMPVRDGDGIAGLAVDESDITLQQYMRTVGRVIAIEDDGRARIIVKVA